MAKVIELVKKMLTTEKEKVYYNNGDKFHFATAITICNTTNAARVIHVIVSDPEKKDNLAGAITYGASLAANASASLPDRYLGPGNTITAWCDVAGAVSISADIIEAD